jgi:hypothetical protein
MVDFRIGDLVQFIPENFDRSLFNYCLIGIGYIENIDMMPIMDVKSERKQIAVYQIYCGKIVKQMMKNFAEIEMKGITFQFTEKQMQEICKKATLDDIE